MANAEPAELARALVPIKDARASFQILRLSYLSLLSHILCTVPTSIPYLATADYDALVEWTLASIIRDDGADAVGLPTPGKVALDPAAYQT